MYRYYVLVDSLFKNILILHIIMESATLSLNELDQLYTGSQSYKNQYVPTFKKIMAGINSNNVTDIVTKYSEYKELIPGVKSGAKAKHIRSLREKLVMCNCIPTGGYGIPNGKKDEDENMDKCGGGNGGGEGDGIGEVGGGGEEEEEEDDDDGGYDVEGDEEDSQSRMQTMINKLEKQVEFYKLQNSFLLSACDSIDAMFQADSEETVVKNKFYSNIYKWTKKHVGLGDI